jgi:4-hydroxy-tetrahydrodipicolinate synthase
MSAGPLRGVFPVLPTPFDDGGQVLYDDIPPLIEWTLQRGVHGVTVCGVTSEVFRLADRERGEIVRIACEVVAKRVPVVVGVGHLSTRLVLETAANAVAAGATALLVPPPPVGASSPAAIREYYAALATSVPTPIILQDDPVHLGVGLSVQSILDFGRSFANIRYGKLEEIPSLDKIREVTEASGGLVSCFGGSGGVFGLEELMAGATGIMTGFAYPEAMVAIYEAWSSGDVDRAHRYNMLISSLTRLEALPKITTSLRKNLYVARGAMSSAAVRSPGVVASSWVIELVLQELHRLDLAWEDRDSADVAHVVPGDHQ